METSTATNSTPSDINARDVWSVIANLSDMDLEAAKQSHGWSVVMDRVVNHAEQAGANWRDVAAGVEAWFVAKMPLPDDQTERAVLAAMHGIHDGIVSGRFPMAEEADERAFEAVLTAVTSPVGEWHSMPDVPALKAMLELLDGVHVATVAASAGDEGEAWHAIAHAVRWISTHAYDAGGDDLAETLAEAVRIVTRNAAQRPTVSA
jgi:hypothetical protein